MIVDFSTAAGAWVINGEPFDPDAVRADFRRDTAERWTLKSGGGWMHPVHLHREEFHVLTRNGARPPADEIARKDVVRIGRSAVGSQGTGELTFFVQMRDWIGDYPLHCHNTIHEDHAMLVRWQIVA